METLLNILKRAFEGLFSLQHLRISDWSKLRFTMETERFWWAIPLMLALAVFGYWSYRRQSATAGKRLAMGLIRAAALVILLGLFLRPQLVLDQESRTPSVVAVWVDDSLSMEISDPYSAKEPSMQNLLKQVSAQLPTDGKKTRADRWDLAIDTLRRDQGQWLHKLAESQYVAFYTGGNHAQLLQVVRTPEEIEHALTLLKQHQPSSEATDLPTVIQEMLRDLQGQPVSALVLLTDGRSTEGTLATVATNAATQYRTPIFSLPVGQEDEPLNVQIAEVHVPESTFVKDPVAVRLKLHVAGIEQPMDLHVTLVRKLPGGGEKELARRDVKADPAVKDMDVDLMFRPEKIEGEKSERYDLEARVDKIGDELTLADNQGKAATTVMDAKITAFLVDGSPRWEFRYLRNELIREKTVDVSTFLVSADDGFAQEGDVPVTRFPETAEELAKYDVLLIGDVEPQFFSPNQMKLIVEWVQKGGGLGWIAGWQYNPDSYRGTLLEPLLPIIPDDPNAPLAGRSDNAPFNLMLTSTGKEANLFRFFDDPEMNLRQIEKDNPPLYWYKPVLGKKPAAEVLAVHPTRTLGGDPAPLILINRYAGGMTFFSAIADTWRWRRYMGEPLYQSYWLQVCRLLYREKAMGQSRRIVLLAEAPTVEVGRPVRIWAQIKDVTLLTGAPAQLQLNVIDETGRPLEPLTLNRVQNSQEMYEGVMTPTLVGDLTLQLAPGLPVEVAPMTIAVGRPRREVANLIIDRTTLNLLAERTEGKVLPLTSAGQLATLISDRSQVTLVSLSEELWNKWIALVLVVGLLTVEWLIRKSAGLI